MLFYIENILVKHFVNIIQDHHMLSHVFIRLSARFLNFFVITVYIYFLYWFHTSFQMLIIRKRSYCTDEVNCYGQAITRKNLQINLMQKKNNPKMYYVILGLTPTFSSTSKHFFYFLLVYLVSLFFFLFIYIHLN